MNKLHEHAYCQEYGKFVDYSIRDEIIEENFHGTVVRFPFRVGRCKECREKLRQTMDTALEEEMQCGKLIRN